MAKPQLFGIEAINCIFHTPFFCLEREKKACAGQSVPFSHPVSWNGRKDEECGRRGRKAFQVFYCYSEDKVFGEAGGGRGYFGGLRLPAIGCP